MFAERLIDNNPILHPVQSAVQAAFNDHQTGDNGNGENDFEFRIDMNDLNDAIGNDSEEELVLGDLKNFFNSWDPRRSQAPSGQFLHLPLVVPSNHV